MSLVCGSRPEVALPAVEVGFGGDAVVAAAVANVELGAEVVEALDVELEVLLLDVTEREVDDADEEVVELGSNTVARLCTIDKNPGRFSEDVCANTVPAATRTMANCVMSR